jgi:uncharacterized membrane protein (DUF373 family)
MMELPRHWTDIRRDWATLTFYQRFEVVVAYLLTIIIGVMIVVALFRVFARIVETLLLRTLDPLSHDTFQQVFGEVMTLLIALEFNHTLQYVIGRERGIIQVRIVVLIALLALARRVIVADLYRTPPAETAALGALALALGLTYRLIGNPLTLRDIRSSTARRRSGATRAESK